MNPIVLLPSAAEYSPEQLRARVMGGICACDFYVSGAEHGEEVAGGFLLDDVLNIDHHAPNPRMDRPVSSATLAIAQLRAHGLPTGTIVVNHTDCDSILSAGIASGRLAPEDRFSEAAIAADHTGTDNDIAELLQSLDVRRDLRLSFRSLDRLLRGEPLGKVAEDCLAERQRKRQAASDVVQRGGLTVQDGVAFGHFDEPLDGEFFPPLLPDVQLFVLASPIRASGKYEIKLRLGPSAPEGLTLHRLNLPLFDPSWGGRWNAGSNKRAGGTAMAPEAYVAEIRRRLTAFREGAQR